MAHILLIEPYYSGSHRAWADGWISSSDHEIGLVTHAAEFWRWRMRGGPVTLAERVGDYIDAHGRPEAIVASDMVDLSSLLGFTRGALSQVPVALYMHENQLLYPLGPAQQPDEGLSLANWRSMLVADAVWFNSEFHLDALFAELGRFLKRSPDESHLHLLAAVVARSSVLPVGVNAAALIDGGRESIPGAKPLVLWNQRWDHDKNPRAVFAALVELATSGIAFEFALAGENQRVDPQEFQRVQERLGDRVVHAGHLPRDGYVELLRRADVVVSAAHHEFFGIAIVEAIAAGAVPVLPDRLSYPEIVPPRWHRSALYPDGDLRVRLEAVLTDIDAARSAVEGLRAAMGRFDWSTVAPMYDRVVSDLLAAGRRGHGI